MPGLLPKLIGFAGPGVGQRQEAQRRVVDTGELSCQHALKASGRAQWSSKVVVKLETASLQEQLVPSRLA